MILNFSLAYYDFYDNGEKNANARIQIGWGINYLIAFLTYFMVAMQIK